MLANTRAEKFNQPQFLPLEAEWSLQIGECLFFEVADTENEKRIGLMNREFLAKGTGMLFKFASSRIVSFWMYQTYIPLDMIFLYKGRVTSIQNNLQNCASSPCPTYGPDHLVDSVIELEAGETKRLNIRVGDRVQIQYKSISLYDYNCF